MRGRRGQVGSPERSGRRAVGVSLAVPVLALAVAATAVSPATAQVAGSSDSTGADPLAPFERLIGGRWYLGDAYQTFEWGVGRKSVVARMYFPGGGAGSGVGGDADTEDRLVSEMTFAWHPGEGTIRAWGVARDMGVDLFEYETRVEGETFVHDLRAWGPAASDAPQRETWELVGPDRYLWTLLEMREGAWTEVMSGTFERRGSGGEVGPRAGTLLPWVEHRSDLLPDHNDAVEVGRPICRAEAAQQARRRVTDATKSRRVQEGPRKVSFGCPGFE